MTDSVYVNAARDKVVEEGPEAAYRIHVRDAKRLGLISEDKPKAQKVEASTAPTNHTRRRATKADDE